jgi:hypothetical protein
VWALDNATPFAAERGFARNRDGAEVWLVAVKGTFSIAPDGGWSVAEKQEPVLLAPKYLKEPGRSSLRYEADLILTKPTTDVLLHGSAHAPRGEPSPQVLVTLSVGPILKTLRVTGDRSWTDARSDKRLTDPAPFVRMPLSYERAVGGVGPEGNVREARNPVGTGFVTPRARHADGTRAPNVEHVAGDRTTEPAGFGPLARDWSPRLERAGTYDAAWMERRRPLVPADFEDRFFQAAPDDQQTPRHLVGGEPVDLVNLTPEGTWRFRLPRIAIGATMSFRGRGEHQSFKLHTVILEPDLRRVLMVWHMALECRYSVYDIRSCRVFLKERRNLGEREPAPSLASPRSGLLPSGAA